MATRVQQTPTFAQLIERLELGAAGRPTSFTTICAEILAEAYDAVDVLTRNPCAGSRMRGPIFSEYCEYRLTGRSSWRIVYSIDSAKAVLSLVFVGEHTLPASIKSWTPPLTRVHGKTATKLSIDDVYASFARHARLTEDQVREVLAALRNEKQNPCC